MDTTLSRCGDNLISWLPLGVSLHKNQQLVFNSPARFRIVVAGRRFGKTELALAELFRAATARPNQKVWFLCPEKQQADRIGWVRLKELTQPLWAQRPSESSSRITLTNGSTIQLDGALRPNSLRGQGIDFLILDEFAATKPEAWREVLRPALADRQGRALLLSTPQGRNHFWDFFEFAQTHAAWQTFQFTTEDGGIVSAQELQAAASEMDPNTFHQEFHAEFGQLGKYRAYPDFSRAIHVKDVRFNDGFPLLWAIDFNVDPMCSLLLQRIGDIIHVLEELIIRPNGTTPKLCTTFSNRAETFYLRHPFRQHPLRLRIYGDASGNQRRTSGTDTDWAIIKQFFASPRGIYEPGYFFNTVNPHVRDRINCVNARINNQRGDANLFIHPSCKELIRDLEEVSWDTDRAGRSIYELNKKDRTRTHTSDALGYCIAQLFSLRPSVGYQSGFFPMY